MPVRFLDEEPSTTTPLRPRMRFLDEPTLRPAPRLSLKDIAPMSTRIPGMPIATVLDVLRGAGKVSAGLVRSAYLSGRERPVNVGAQIAGAFQGRESPDPEGLGRATEELPADLLQLLVPVAGTAAVTAAGLATRGIAHRAGVGGIRLLRSTPHRTRFIGEVRQQLRGAKSLAGDEFDIAINRLVQSKPDTRIDLSEILEEVQQKALKNPSFKSLLDSALANDRESALLQGLINQPGVATNLSLRDARKVKAVFSRSLKRQFERPNAHFAEAQLDALDTWHQIRAQELGAFPELTAEFAKYKGIMDSFRTIRQAFFKPGSTSIEGFLMSGFGKEAEVTEAFKKLLTPALLHNIQQLQRALQTSQFFGRLGRRTGEGAALVGGGALLAKLLGIGQNRNEPRE